jgi:dTDP-4-dehydrorhamnose 3,5-epimerase
VKFHFEATALPDVILVSCGRQSDERGSFSERYRKSAFVEAGIRDGFVQDNCSISRRGVLRGLHCQAAPRAQGKLVWVSAGSVYDVAVDLRRGSPTFARWVGHTLTGENDRMLYIPAGFAHGYVVLSDTACVNYKCTAEHSPAHERGIRWNDPAIGIGWPVLDPVLSPRDRALPFLAEADVDSPATGDRGVV